MSRSIEWNRVPADQQEIILRHQNELPVKVGAISKELGLIVKKSTLKPGISGQIKETDGEVVIKINRHDTVERQRFTLAHEIAHFLLHKEEIKGGIEDTMLFRSSLSNELEVEANKLAADIVMPYDLINNVEFPSGIRFEERVERVASLAEMSIPAVEIRLGKRVF